MEPSEGPSLRAIKQSRNAMRFEVLPTAEVRHTVLDDFGRKNGQA